MMPIPQEQKNQYLEVAQAIANAMLEKKGEDIVIMDVRRVTYMADYFVLATASSDIHAKAITENVMTELKKKESHPHHVEGRQHSRWVLIDFIDVVAHVFLKESREYYNLERL